jgi:hypothetical protein
MIIPAKTHKTLTQKQKQTKAGNPNNQDFCFVLFFVLEGFV